MPDQAEGGGDGALQPGHPVGAAPVPPRRGLAVPQPHPGRPTIDTDHSSCEAQARVRQVSTRDGP